MIDFFLAPGNTPFTIALTLMLVFTVIEVISASLGMGLSEMVDSLLPEFDADLDIELDGGEAGGPGSLVSVLTWFRVGEVPVLMLFIVFLTGFGVIGLCLQYATTFVFSFMVPTFVAAAAALAGAIPCVRIFGGVLARFMPADETYAVSEESFPGLLATVTTGEATKGKPAQAKLKDEHGQTHYILVEPDNPEERFQQGQQGIIVRRQGSIYTVITPTEAMLQD